MEGPRRRLDLTPRDTAFLAAATGVVTAAQDYQAALESLARLIASRIGDWCVIDIVHEDRSSSFVVAHADPARESAVREVRRSLAEGIDSDALHTGRAKLVTVTRRSPLPWRTRETERDHVLQAHGIHAYAVVPMSARGRTFGSITVVSESSRRSFDSDNLPLLEELALRVVGAVDNARLYAEAQRANKRLQTLAWAATEAQAAPDEDTVFRVLGAGITRVDLNAHVATWAQPLAIGLGSHAARAASGMPGGQQAAPVGDVLVIRHVALIDGFGPIAERLMGRPAIGVQISPDDVEPYRKAVREGTTTLLSGLEKWARQAHPWLPARALRVFQRANSFGQAVTTPITDGYDVLGVLTVWGRSITDSDRAAMELLGRQAGGALAALRLRQSERERHRLDGAMLVARTAAHEINNALSLPIGFSELLASHPKVAADPQLTAHVEQIRIGAQQAADTLYRLQRMIRLEETPSPLGKDQPVLDLDLSTKPANSR